MNSNELTLVEVVFVLLAGRAPAGCGVHLVAQTAEEATTRGGGGGRLLGVFVGVASSHLVDEVHGDLEGADVVRLRLVCVRVVGDGV